MPHPFEAFINKPPTGQYPQPDANRRKQWDEEVTQQQAQDPPWKQGLRSALDGGVDALQGMVGMGDDSQSNQIGQLVGAGLPMAGMFGKLRGAMGGAAQAPRMGRMAGPTLDILEDAAPIAQTGGSMDDVSALIGSMKYNLAKLPRPGTQANQMPHMPAEFRQAPGPGAMEGLQKAIENPYHAEMISKYLRK